MCIYLRCFLQLKGATELGLGSLTVRLRALPEPAMQTSSGPGHSDPKATDEVEGMEDWTGVDDGYDDGGYFNMERYLTPPEPAPEAPKKKVLLPLKSRSRSPQRMAALSRMFIPDLYTSCRATGRMHLSLPGMKQFLPKTDSILEAMAKAVPACGPRGHLRGKAQAEAEGAMAGLWVQGLPIDFVPNLISEGDDLRMLNIWKKDFKTPGVYVYAGISEAPTRRAQEHCAQPPAGRMPILIQVVRVAYSSQETGDWEIYAIAYLRQHGLRCLNKGDGGESRSEGQPHYGYLMQCR